MITQARSPAVQPDSPVTHGLSTYRSRSLWERQAFGCPALDGASQLGDLPVEVLNGTQRGADVLHRAHDPVNALGDRELEHRAERFRGAVDLTVEHPGDGQGAAGAGHSAERPVQDWCPGIGV